MGSAKVVLHDVWIFLRLLFQMYWFYQRINFVSHESDITIVESFNVSVMKKKKNEEEQLSDNANALFDPHQNETDALIIERLNIRKEENQALKKILENLNQTVPKIKS
jgi:hypothetical protein